MFTDINTIPSLTDNSIDQDTILVIEGLNGQYFKITKGKLIEGLHPIDAQHFRSQNGYVRLGSANVNGGGYNVYLPGTSYTPTVEGEPIIGQDVNLSAANDDIQSETEPTVADFPVGKSRCFWTKPSTGEQWLCTAYNGSVKKIQFQ